MAATASKRGANILSEIVDWSKGLPEWQRDALRRIIEQASLSASDIDELTAACRAAHGLSEESVPELDPIAGEHLPTGAGASHKVTLCSVSDAENVNAIDSKQSLQFAPTGLTVIFGYNGSGKSGYGRVLRRACRARSKGDAILPNVLQEAPRGPASAVITYAVDGVEQPPEQWIDGQRAVDLLGSVSFFDSDCASVHVRGKNDIAFTPFGLDVLPSLATGCKAVQEKIDTERKQLEACSPHFLKSSFATGSTKVGNILRSLKPATSVDDLEALASLSETELTRLKEIPAQLSADPQKLAKELRTRAGRIEALRVTLLAASSALSEESINAIRVLAKDAEAKTMAAEVAAQQDFANDPLTNIGDSVWQQLWSAARKYSEIAFPERDFPVTDGEDAVCVLCQQPLSDDAKGRLNRFEQFVRDDSAKQAAKARQALEDALQKVRGLGLRDTALREQLKDVESGDSVLLVLVRRHLATLLRRFHQVETAHKSGQWAFEIAGVFGGVDEQLSALVSSMNAKAAEAEKSANVAERQRLENELAELKAREWLATVLGDVKEHVDRLEQIEALKKASKEARTTRITTKSKDLAKEHVTDQLRNAFADEVKKMQQGVRRLNVEMIPTDGEYGSSYYRVQLVGAPQADIIKVVSEGEHRCIALAGFLSELATEPCKSTVIFDDPVTSLDHHWRSCFAKRLVEEAADRQVIVFTHEIAFLHDLCGGAEEHGVPIELRRVQSNRENCGFVDESLPWIAQKTLPRIDELEKRARGTRSSFDAQNDDEYEREICAVYSEFRATIERTVEEKLFLGIVTRHQDYISLGNLKKVTAITVDHCERLQKLFKKCCDITSAHDRASLRGFGVPTPDDALDDLKELRTIVDDVKEKQKAVS